LNFWGKVEIMSIKELLDVVAKLRSPEGCPWDKEQTPASLTRYILEEAFEAVEAIDSGDSKKIKEELGDCLFQVVLQAQIASETGKFNFEDIVQNLTQKMIRRHPHVFAGENWGTAAEVKERWEEQKKKEKAAAGSSTEKITEELKMPSLLAALKIGERSENWKFDWENQDQVFAKVKEEIDEVFEVLEGPQGATTQERLEDEFGDFLFASAQWARHLGVEPEMALRKANAKFQKRFSLMIKDCGLNQHEFYELPLEKKEELWSAVKKKLKTQS
jgi:tetrapyrrole methylase family protein/MazG family protein